MPRLRDDAERLQRVARLRDGRAGRASDGFARVSLNFAPFAELLAPEVEPAGAQRVAAAGALALKGRFQLDNLLAFNRKFFPRWQRRYVVYERRLDLPRVGIAALAAEAYLPLAGRDDDDGGLALGLALASARRCALNWGLFAQHGAAAGAAAALARAAPCARSARSSRAVAGSPAS